MARIIFDFGKNGGAEVISTYSDKERICRYVEKGIETNQLIDGAKSHKLISKNDSEIGKIFYKILPDGENEITVTIRY